MLVDITCVLHCAHMKYPLPFPSLKFQVSSWSTLPEDTWTIPSNFICLTHHVSTSSPQPEDIWTIPSNFICLTHHVSTSSPQPEDIWTILSHFILLALHVSSSLLYSRIHGLSHPISCPTLHVSSRSRSLTPTHTDYPSLSYTWHFRFPLP